MRIRAENERKEVKEEKKKVNETTCNPPNDEC